MGHGFPDQGGDRAAFGCRARAERLLQSLVEIDLRPNHQRNIHHCQKCCIRRATGPSLGAVRLGFAVVAEQFLLTNPKLSRVKLHSSLLARVPLPAAELWLVGHRALREVPRVAATWAFLVERFRAPQ